MTKKMIGLICSLFSAIALVSFALLLPTPAYAAQHTPTGDVVLAVDGSDSATLIYGAGETRAFTPSSDELILGSSVTSVVIDGGGFSATVLNVIFTGVSIDKSTTATDSAFALRNAANVHIALQGSNTLKSGQDRAGLEVPSGCAITIGVPSGQDNAYGTLTSSSNGNGAGIGSALNTNTGSISIAGGTINAYSCTDDIDTNVRGAGIGGGSGGSASTINISGGIVTAYSSYGYELGAGAGVGGGSADKSGNGSGGIITISGTAQVTAASARIHMSNGAGIGSGSKNTVGTSIIINGGTVNAYSTQSSSQAIGNGAGIGGGWDGTSGTVEINDGIIYAVSSLHYAGLGAGIGGGRYCDGGSISITGGTVTAISCETAAGTGAGVGGGASGGGGTISISGGTVTAYSSQTGSGNGAGIGGGAPDSLSGSGSGGSGGTITISGGVIVAASSRDSIGKGAGIGGAIGGVDGTDGSAGNIEISGGTVFAASSQNSTGSSSGIGVAAGGSDPQDSVVISGGSVFVPELRNLGSGSEGISPAPTNGTEPLYPAELVIGNPPVENALVSEGSLGGVPMGDNGYGKEDMETNGSGKICLWLPEDNDVEVSLTINDVVYTTTVSPTSESDPAPPAPAKAAGYVEVPTVFGEVTPSQITVATIEPTTGQEVEYAISQDGTSAPTSWQAGTTFTGLTPGEGYYVWSRTLENDGYHPGTPTPSSIIETPTELIRTSFWVSGNEYTLKSGVTLSLSCNIAFDATAIVSVDGKTIGVDKVVLSAGSTVATLQAAYLDTLSVGSHEIKLQFSDGSHTKNAFQVKKASSPSPGTNDSPKDQNELAKAGDDSSGAILGVVFIGAVSALAFVRARKASHH